MASVAQDCRSWTEIGWRTGISKECILVKSSFFGLGKEILNKSWRILGLEMRRIPSNPLPQMFRDPLEAVSQMTRGSLAAIESDLSLCVIVNGMSFAPESFHFFAQTANKYLKDGHKTYCGSLLEQYYTIWQPANAQEALICAFREPTFLVNHPRHLLHTPWHGIGPNERMQQIARTLERESLRYGKDKLCISDGITLHGPVSKRKGELEILRIVKVVDSIQYRGYDRLLGDVVVEVLQRGKELRFKILHGHHRVAALSALGYSTVPCRPKKLVNIKDVENWPQVRNGTWTKANAIEYFNHLFDFDSQGWARRLGLLK